MKPDSYVGDDVSVTIKTNNKGLGTADAIKKLIDGINVDDQSIVQILQALKNK